MADDEKKKKEPERRSIRIDEYFIKAAKSDSVEREIAEKKKEEEEEGENNQQKEVALQDLKCPKRKLVFETDDTDDIAKKKQAVRNRKSGGAMKKLEKGQRILDCGQKLIGSTTCKDCEMVYCVDDAADVKAHEKFHREWKFRFEIPKTFVMQMLKFYNRDMNDYKVYYLHTSGEEAFKKLMSKHIGVINTYLGYTGTDDVWSTDKRIFMILLLREERMMIGGILIIEKVTKAYTNVTRKEITATEDVNDWIVGVDRLWVDPYCRRKNVATCLLDAATTQDRQMEFRSRRLRVAFSDPTDDGAKVAAKYMETRYLPEHRYDGEILVY